LWQGPFVANDTKLKFNERKKQAMTDRLEIQTARVVFDLEHVEKPLVAYVEVTTPDGEIYIHNRKFEVEKVRGEITKVEKFLDDVRARGSIDPVYWNFIRAIYGSPAWEHEVECAERRAYEDELEMNAIDREGWK
jgi:hypothetical protein